MSENVNETTMSDSFRHKIWELARTLSHTESDDTELIVLYYSKFTNKDRTGLIDKLKDDLDFDIPAIAGENETQQQSAIELLTILFEIEKAGKRFKIIDFLKHPSMQNLAFSMPHSSEINYEESYQNSMRFENLLLEIRSHITGLDIETLKMFGDKPFWKNKDSSYREIYGHIRSIQTRDLILNLVNERWDLESEKMLGYVLSDTSIENIQSAIETLDQIEKLLISDILQKLPEFLPCKTHCEEVMLSFHNLLACHKIQCINADMIQISQEILYEETPTEDFIQLLKEHETEWIDTEKVKEFQKYLFSQKKNKAIIPEYELLLSLISHQQGYTPEEKGTYKFALENFMTIVEWWSERYPKTKRVTDDGRTEISIVTFVNIIQEMMFVKRNNETISNKYYGYNNPNSSLRKAVLKPEEADPKATAAWVSKIENRTVVNFGSSELIIKKRKIEAIFYQIKEFIYSQHNLADIEDVSEAITYIIAQKFVQDVICTSWRDFSENITSLLSKLNPDMEQIAMTFSLPFSPRSPKFYDMLYDFFLCRDDAKEIIVSQISEKINCTYNAESPKAKFFGIPITIKYSENHTQQYRLFFSFSPDTNTICFQNFLPESRFKKIYRQ